MAENFISFNFLSNEVWIPLTLSLKVAIWATFFSSVLGIAAGYFLAKKNHFICDFLDSVLTLPIVLPPTVLGYYLLVLIGNNSFLGEYLAKFFNVSLVFTWQGAVIAASVVSFPLVYKSSRASFENVSSQFEEAARVLGVSQTKIFFKIIFPLAWRGIFSGIMLAFARSLGEFGATLMVAGSIPGKTQTLSIAVYEAVQIGHYNLANFLVFIISLACILIMILSSRLFYYNNKF